MKVLATFSVFVSAFASIAVAYVTPVGNPLGNPITRPLLEIVPAGEPFTITWTPTTPKDQTISLVLYQGPAENLHELYSIVEGIPNTGSYVWTPRTDLVPDVTHYGLRLIVDATGQYQWSTQFGIGKAKDLPASSTVVSSTVIGAETDSKTSTTSVESATTTPCDEATTTTTPCDEATTTVEETYTTTVPCPGSETTSIAPIEVSTTSIASNTPIGPYPNNTSILIVPTPQTTLLTTTTPLFANSTTFYISPTTTNAPPPMHTGAAGKNVVSLGMGAIAAVAALALF